MLMNDIYFSIICPLYNAEDYLNACIQSIIKQTYHKWELILVDDGSTDTSPKICDNYAKQDKRIRVIHQINMGQFESRLKGIEASSGDYLLFLDSDDYFFENALLRLLDYCKKNYDVIIFRSSKSDHQNVSEPCQIDYTNSIELFRSKALLNKYTQMQLKCIKSTIIKSINVPKEYRNRNFGEDFVHTILIADKVNSVIDIGIILYYYRFRNDSSSHRVTFFTFNECFNFNVFDLQKKYSKKWNIETKEFGSEINIFWLEFLFSFLIDSFKSETLFKKRKIKEYLNCMFYGSRTLDLFKNINILQIEKNKKRILMYYYKKNRIGMWLFRELFLLKRLIKRLLRIK